MTGWRWTCLALLASPCVSAQKTVVPSTFKGDSDFVSTRGQRIAFQEMNPNVQNLYMLPFTDITQQSPHGRLFPQVLGNTPILGTLREGGMSQVAFQLDACGSIPMHFHPRATEFAHVTSGSVVYGFTLDDGSGNVEQVYEQGQTAVIPQANMHFIENRSCKPASFVVTLSHPDPGTTFVTDYFQFSDQALKSTLGHGATQELIDAFRSILSDPRNAVPVADPACLQRCGVRVGAQG